MRRTLLGMAVMALSTIPAAAGASSLFLDEYESRSWSPRGAQEVGPSCSGGQILDDGGFETALGSNVAPDLRFVQRFTPASYPGRVDKVCVCWVRSNAGQPTLNYHVQVYDDNGPAGTPGTLLGQKAATVTLDGPDTLIFGGTRCAELDIAIPSGGLYLGARWDSAAYPNVYLCTDTSPATPMASAFASTNGGASWAPAEALFTPFRAFGIRAEISQSPPPPTTGAFTSAEFPGYRFWVRFAGSKVGVADADCLPFTVCVAAAPGSRVETLLRILGPKPNGFLWFAVAKFNLPKTEIWVEQLGTGKLNYYLLPAVTEAESEIPGFVDKEAFLP